MATGASQRRSRAGADRCAQGRPDPDPPPQLHPQPHRREARRPGGQQDRPRRLRRRRLQRQIEADYQSLRRDPRLRDPAAIPVSALKGDNILDAERRTRRGTAARSSMPYLESIEVGTDRVAQPMRFPVQWVNRPNLDFRGFSGTVASGVVKVGDDVLVAASRKPAKVTRIVTMDGDQPEAIAGEAVTRRPRPRGRHLARRRARPIPARRPNSPTSSRPASSGCPTSRPSRPLLSPQDRRADRSPASITDLKFKTNVNTLEHSAAKTLELNEVGTVTIATDKPIAFDPYADNGRTGGFILIDRITNATLGAGVIDFGLRRAQNLSYQSFDVNREVRARHEGPDRLDRLVHRPLRLGQVDGRQPRSRSASPPRASTPTSSTATTSATASTRTSASPRKPASRTSAASPKWPA